jgi:hypothetical protein
MATLQATRQWSASTAKARLKQTPRERVVQKVLTEPDEHEEDTVIHARQPAVPTIGTTSAYQGRLSDLEQRLLLLQTVATYPGWHVVSVQHRPESDVLVAYLVRQYDNGDSLVSIREGRAMQIIMDAVGDLKVQHPRRKHESLLQRLLHRLESAFGASERASGRVTR